MRLLISLAAVLSAAPAFASSAGAGEIPDPAEGWDHLWYHLLLDIGAIGVVFGLITVVFLVRYTRKREDQEGDAPKLSFGQSMGWAMIPMFLFLADDFYLAANGWKLWNDQRRVPENAMEVEVEAMMYGWYFTYDNGVESDNFGDGLVVPEGKPVVLRMKSTDVIHSFFIPDFRIKEDVMPGRVTYLWINPTASKRGEHVFTCTEYCGFGHSNMFGKVKVVSPREFEEWMAERQA
ncbi:MAG: cytochrome c oxidase subunit II [Candidatus Nitrospinota bacterium M3_3B_026]